MASLGSKGCAWAVAASSWTVIVLMLTVTVLMLEVLVRDWVATFTMGDILATWALMGAFDPARGKPLKIASLYSANLVSAWKNHEKL